MTSPVLEFDLKAAIRTIPDYPKPGILFRDITTLLGNARAFRRAVDELVIHEDAVVRGERVILVDDLVATGGTAEGAVKLLRQMGAEVLAACFIIDLPELGGADKIRKLDVPVRTLISFPGH